MRLHRLVITGVGPFRDRQEIDFDELTESGLFLIDGATGSGKTTIIDSIVYALFGVVSGGNDSDVTRMRSHYCSETDPTGVTCEFTVDGRRHTISRIPAGARDPEAPDKASTSKPARQILRELNADGSDRVVLTKDREITEHVVDLLRMNADQFRQLVVLPQGQFAHLLTMTPLERLGSLASLLGEDFFERVQADLQLQGVMAEAERAAAHDAVAVAAQRLAGRLKTYVDGQDPEPLVDFCEATAPDEGRLAAVDALLAALSDQAAAAVMQRDTQSVETSAAVVAATSAHEVADSLREVGATQVAVAAAESELDSADAGIGKDTIANRVGEFRKLEGSLGEHTAWEAEAPQRQQNADVLSQRETQCLAEATLRRTEKGSIPVARKDLESRRSLAERLAATAAAAVAEEVRLSALLSAANELTALSPELDRFGAALFAAEEVERMAIDAAAAARARWEAMLDQHRVERAAQLAATLAPGGACPVCGSMDHPQPAHASGDAVLVSDAAVEKAKAAEGTASRAAAAAAKSTTGARRAVQDVERQVATLTGALGELTPEAIAAQHEAAVGRQESAADAQAELDDIASELSNLTEREGVLDAEIAELDSAATQAKATGAALQAAEQARAAQIRKAIGTADSATTLLATTQARVAALAALLAAHAALDAAAAGVPADKRTASPEAASSEAARAAEVSRAATAALGQLTERANALASAIDDAGPLRDSFAACLSDRSAIIDRTADHVSLAALVSAKNTRSLHLRSYALQRRFESVLVAASNHLERMSSGKFTFELGEHSGRGSAGLGIAIHDAWTGQLQEPKSLSGGETFYASLSLALGLADIVKSEAGGSSLETLFIDEGFGSLDQDTLYQVLDQLDEMRAGRRAVGVVSHVTEMKESISDRIEVRRQADSTSTIVRPSVEIR